MRYKDYISSVSWKEKREARLEIDGRRCRLCDEDGTRYGLEVHHRPSSYSKIPNESIQDDLITVCSRCHIPITDAIREDRYGKREHKPTILKNIIKERQEINHGLANFEIQIDGIRPASYAQRADSRPNKQMVKIDQTDFVKTRKDRRGL